MWQFFEKSEGGKQPERPTRTPVAGRLSEFGDRQHQPHQVHLPGDRQSVVDLLQVPVDGAFGEPHRPGDLAHVFAFGQRDCHLTLGRRQPEGPRHEAGIDTTMLPRLDNQDQGGDGPRSVVRLRVTHGFDVHHERGQLGRAAQQHRPAEGDSTGGRQRVSHQLLQTQLVLRIAGREQPVVVRQPATATEDPAAPVQVDDTDLVAWIIPKDALSSCFSTQGITWMPHKFNAARRHKFDKAQYRVIHWAEYNESLRQRGDLTIWVSEEAQSVWSAPRRTSRGGQWRYSDLAIETCLPLRTAYRLALRQTQGLMGSIGTLMGLDIRVPDYSTLSRRANGLSIAQAVRQAGSVPVHLVVDSTGLKIFGEGEWLAQKHKTKGIRRRWRKLHLGLDLASGAIVCANLTHDDVGDSTALPGFLDQLDAPVTGFLADGAYDGASTRDLLRERYGETLDVVIPPPKNAVIRPQSARDPTVRDRHIAQIRSNGRMACQAATGYNQRSRIETQIGRWKGVIGPKLKSRSFSRQITEIKVGQKVRNTMTALGRPVFERIA